MAVREAVDLQRATGQTSFSVDQQQRFSLNLLEQTLGRLGPADGVAQLIFSRKAWQERPQKRGGPTALVDLLDATNRRIYFMDDDKRLYTDQEFNRDQKLRLGMAVVLIEPITVTSEPVIKADLEAIMKKLVPSGGLIVVEKRVDSQSIDENQRLNVLNYTPGFKRNRLKQPEFLTIDPNVIVWETRRKKPNETWKAIAKRNQEVTNRREGVGRHTFINPDGSGTTIVDVGPKTMAVSKVGEQDGLGSEVDFKGSVVVPPINTDAERRLSFGLAGKGKQEKAQPKSYLLGPRQLKIKCSNGSPITETIWTEGVSQKTGKVKLKIAKTCSCHGDLNLETKYVRPKQIIQQPA